MSSPRVTVNAERSYGLVDLSAPPPPKRPWWVRVLLWLCRRR